jgi:hypothetical protein
VSLDVETSGLFSGSGESSEFSVFMDWVADPVDSSVVSDGVVSGVNTNHFEKLVGSVFSDPVRVQNSQGGHFSTHSFLGGRSQVSGEFEFVYSLRSGFSVDDSLGNGSFSTSSSHFHSVNHESLFGLVSQSAGFIRS